MSADAITTRADSAVPAERPRDRSLPWMALGVAGLVGALFARRLAEYFAIWKEDANYSHGFLVPLISGYFAYRIYREQGPPRHGNLPAGLALLLVGCLLHLSTSVLWLP